VFSLKDTLREFLQKDAGEQAASFKRQFDLIAHLLDQLGLFAFETISRSHEGAVGLLAAPGGLCAPSTRLTPVEDWPAIVTFLLLRPVWVRANSWFR